MKPVNWYKSSIEVNTQGKGLYPCTPAIQRAIQQSGIRDGMCFLFLQHTSASLLISESFDPTAKEDLEQFMERLAPERESWYRHTMEGSDDSPSHIRSMLTSCSETIPIENGQLALGTWQGLYLFEHRKHAHRRRILIRCMSMDE
jgi:secondary thiamine-phosphate synthase enzyme